MYYLSAWLSTRDMLSAITLIFTAVLHSYNLSNVKQTLFLSHDETYTTWQMRNNRDKWWTFHTKGDNGKTSGYIGPSISYLYVIPWKLCIFVVCYNCTDACLEIANKLQFSSKCWTHFVTNDCFTGTGSWLWCVQMLAFRNEYFNLLRIVPIQYVFFGGMG
jgi:ABC-type multidrug transport system permease subunit